MSINDVITRRDLLTTAATASVSLLGLGTARAAAGRPRMNVVLFITDQERATQHFPPHWEETHLLNLTRLKENGLTFENAFTNSCMCTPARCTLMSGYFPAQHRAKFTLERNMPTPPYPQVVLPLDLKNIATVMAAAGYNVVYKGKWHCSKPAGVKFTPDDLAAYGFSRWDPPDAGANQDIIEGGGGRANNDGRFMNSDGPVETGDEGVLAYLNSQARKHQPFFLVVSLVNPHDVLFYPTSFIQAGYDKSWLEGDIGLPDTLTDTLLTKPTVQRQFLFLANLGLGELKNDRMKRHYLNFYGNLMKSSDGYLGQVLDALEGRGLLDNTLIIRTADHGEMGLAHGGLRQKNFNFYEESLRVPLVYSNPQLYPVPRSTTALVSHVDLLPTLAGLFGAPRADWQGVDYSSLVLDPSAKPVQDYIVFTYDDFQSGQNLPPYPGITTPPFQPAPNHIVSIREERYKLAEYYAVGGELESQWEMYDLEADPLEERNLAAPRYPRTPEQQFQYQRLTQKLREVQATRLRPFA